MAFIPSVVICASLGSMVLVIPSFLVVIWRLPIEVARCSIELFWWGDIAFVIKGLGSTQFASQVNTSSKVLLTEMSSEVL